MRAPKTRCGGMISPSVRVSFAMRFRRVSAAVGKTGVVGVVLPNEEGVPGVPGVAGSVSRAPGDLGAGGPASARGAAASRRTSGRGASAGCGLDLHLDLPNFMLGLRERELSEVVREGGSARETVELALDGEA